jgi:hypothetical protein
LTVPNWSTKDIAPVFWDGSVFHFFYSAFFSDTGMERCHVAMSTSPDLKTFSQAKVLFDGLSAGFAGMCSPGLVTIGGQYVMTLNSWGDVAGMPDQLFYSTSSDLVNWAPMKPIAANLTAGSRGIDVRLATANGKIYLIWKNGGPPGNPKMAVATSLDGPWTLIGSGSPTLLMQSGMPNGLTHENYQMMNIDGRWRLMCTDYNPQAPYLYAMVGMGTSDTDWLSWNSGYTLNIVKETFNTVSFANAAHLSDWRSHDGYFYLFYAGNTETTTHAGRGDNTIGVSRSMDLMTWIPAGH